MLRFTHIKNDKLKVQIKNCIFIEYIKGVKRYKLWRFEPKEARCLDDTRLRCFISNNFIIYGLKKL